MRWLLSIFGHTLALRVAFVVVAAALAWFGIGSAKAQTNQYGFSTQCTSSNPITCDKGQAYTVCEANRVALFQKYPNPQASNYSCKVSGGGTGNSWTYFYYTTPTTLTEVPNAYYFAPCPVGTEWFDSEHQCLQPCLDRNPSTPPNYGYWTLSNAGSSMCKSGCSFSRGDTLETRSARVCGSGQCTDMAAQVRAVWRYNGAKCSSQPADPPPPKDDDVSCTPATANQTYCIRPNGENCYTASSGRMICWKANEQGTKTDGPTTQTNNAGDEQPNPPPGSQHTSQVKTTTSTTSNSSTTTTNTYTTSSGAPAGSSNQGTGVGSNGKPSSGGGTGTGTGSGGGDEGDEDGNSASGGGDCDSPPITSGDAILGMVATQTWATRCAVESGNAAKVTGDVGDCKSAFSVEGTNANAVKLRAMRAQICGPSDVAASGDIFDSNAMQAIEYGDGDGPPDDEPSDPLEGKKVERDGNWFVNQLDNAGFLGGGSCPADSTISVGSGAVKLSMQPLCQLLGAISGLVIALAYLIAFRIMAT